MPRVALERPLPRVAWHYFFLGYLKQLGVSCGRDIKVTL